MAAKAARFKVGSSGSGKHTEVQGNGEGMGGPASRPPEMGPRIGAGVMGKRVTPEYDRDTERGNERRAIGPRPKGIKEYSEE